MTRVVVRGGFDTYANADMPARDFGGAKFLRVEGESKYSYLYLKNPAPRGATIVSAVLRLKTRGAWNSASVLTAVRIADPWKASKLNWNNKPGVLGQPRTVAVAAGVADGTVVEFDVTTHLQTVVNGSPHYGWRIKTDATDAPYRFYGFDAGDNKPTLVVTYSDKPGAPTNLSPAGGAVSIAKPVVQFDYGDVNGDDLVAVQVQIDPAANGSSPAFDSGEVVSDVPELDLADTTYAGLAAGASTQWRARVKDAGGLWSDWSDWETFNRVNKSALTIDNPSAASPFVNEPTPPIIWTFGGTQKAWQVRVTRGDDRSFVLYDSGRRKGAADSHALPKRSDLGNRLLVDDRTYQVNVRVWDDVDREATPGDPVFTFEWRTFNMDDDIAVSSAENLTATQEGETPWVALEWTRATAPDSFVVLRQGPDDDKPRVIESDLDPADLLTGGVYRWRDATAKPRETQTYYIKAVVNGRQSPRSSGASVATAPTGVWIIDYDRDLSFVLHGLDVENWQHVDQGVIYQPLGSPYSVRIVQGLNGLIGSFRGTLTAADGRSAASYERHLWRIKERPADTVRLIADDMSIPVKLHDLTCSVHPDSTESNPRKLAGFQFRQVGNLPFEARI